MGSEHASRPILDQQKLKKSHDLILLHLAIWLNATDANADTTRHIMELVIADMDQSLREMGVGDMSIGKKVDKMAFAMNGRLQAYTASGDDPDAWTHAIAHNVYRQDSHPQAERLADYALRAKAQLSQSNAELNWPAL